MEERLKRAIADWEEECQRIYAQKALPEEFTDSGIRMKPVYTIEDIRKER